MSNKHDIDTYSKLQIAAEYFLNSSFASLNKAMIEESLSLFYQEELMKIEISEKDDKIFRETEVPSDPVEILQASDIHHISGDLMNKLLGAKRISDERLKDEKIKFRKNKKITSIEILGHLNNFGFFIETLINRHLLFLSHTGTIDKTIYNRVSIAKIMERIIYIFKDEINDNSVQINEIINLFSLRNKTVHFTPDNAKALKVEINELYRIWKQTIKLLKRLEKQERFVVRKFSKLLEEKSKEFKSDWN